MRRCIHIATAALMGLATISAYASYPLPSKASDVLSYQQDSAKKHIEAFDQEEARRWSDELTETAKDSDTYNMGLCMQASMNVADGKREGVAQTLERIINVYSSRNDTTASRILATAYCAKGYLGFETSDEGADRNYKKAERYAELLGDTGFKMFCLMLRCNLYLRNERFVEAAYFGRQLLQLSNECGNEEMRFWAQLCLYNTYSHINAESIVRNYAAMIEDDDRYSTKKTLTLAYCKTISEDNLRHHRPETALGFAEQAIRMAAFEKVSATTKWQTNLLMGKTLIMLGNIEEAKKHVAYCRENIDVIDQRMCDAEYSRHHVALLEAEIALAEKRYGDAERGLAQAHIPPMMLKKLEFGNSYYRITETIYEAEQNYAQARRILNAQNELKRETLHEFIKMRDKDMEIAYREDTTIMQQKQMLASRAEDISKMEEQITLVTLSIVAAIMLVLLLYLALRSKARVKKQLHDEDYKQRLVSEVAKQTKAIELHNKMIMLKNADMQASQTYARHLQRGILPNPENLGKLGGGECFVVQNTVATTCNNFYWFKKVGSRIVVCCAGCMGEGVASSMQSMVGLTLIDDIVSIDGGRLTASELLGEFDKALIRTLPDNKWRNGIEISICIIDTDNKQINLSSAMLSPLLLTGEELKAFDGAVRLAGVSTDDEGDDAEFVDDTFDYKHGDELFLFTSGVVCLNGGDDNEPLGEEGLCEILCRVAKLPNKLQKQALLNEIQRWSHGQSINDDMLILGITL